MSFERALVVLTPIVAIATVGLGLRVGGGQAVRAAVVTGAPAGGGGTGLAWQLVVLDQDMGVRIPAALPSVDVVATAGGQTSRWHGATNEDGVAELSFALPAGPIHVDVMNGKQWLASGDAEVPPSLERDPLTSAWARFARREGDVSMDVAILGQRGASGFPASIWVHALDGKTHAPLAGASIECEHDASLTPALASFTTDERGWAHLTATPLGYSVPLVLHAKSGEGKTGEWAGGLFISPGASQIVVKDVVAPDEPVAIEVAVPSVRTTAYVEIDDAKGRVWATAAPVHPSMDATPRTSMTGPKLAPGLYWVATAGDLTGASTLGPGTMTRPFFVAKTPEEALAFGTDPATCAAPGDVRMTSRVVSECLALVAPTGVPRWTAVDGFAFQAARDAMARARGMAIGLPGIFVAIVLEAVLLLRAAAVARARLRAAEQSEEGDGAKLVGRGWSVAIGVLLGLLGLALLGAFFARTA